MALLTGPVDLDFEQRLARKGRPVRNRVASARVTADELKLLEQAAHAEGKLLAEWARDELLRASRFSKDDALFTEVVAIRLFLHEMLGPIAASQAITPRSSPQPSPGSNVLSAK